MLASEYGNKEVVELLLRYKANLNMVDGVRHSST